MAALRDATDVPMSVGRVQLRMSVGLHSGTVQLFRLGSLHQELIITGPGATRTTQMEHAASAGQIFVSPEMAERLPAGATRPGPDGAMVLRWRRAPVTPPGPRARRPVDAGAIDRWLPEVLRVHLQPGESRRVEFVLEPASDLRRYDAQAGAYVVDPGEYEIQAGASSADIRARTTLTVPGG